jgi:hypothetical protein
MQFPHSDVELTRTVALSDRLTCINLALLKRMNSPGMFLATPILP